MAKYTQLELQEISNLAKRYDLKISDYEVIEGGAANSSFFLKANGSEYVLTIADDKSLEEAQGLVILLERLSEYGFPTSRIIPTMKGEKLSFFGEKAVVVKKFIPGRTQRDISSEGLISLGKNLAMLHQIPSPKCIPQTHSYGSEFFPNAYGQNFDLEFEEWLARKVDYFEDELSSSLPRGLIHADVFWDNIIFKNNKFQALIDFEDACYYYKVYDLASALYGICIENGELNLEKGSQIIKGYEQIRYLGPNEKKTLKVLTVYAGVAISYWRYMKYNLHNPSKVKKDFHKKSAVIADRIQAIPLEIFSKVFD